MKIDGEDLAKLGRNIRVMIYVERRPLSDHFEQLMLTEDQYRRLNNFLFALMPADGPHRIITLQDKRPITIENAKTTYTQQEILASPDEGVQ